LNKSSINKQAGLSRASLYYRPKLPARDWALKVKIEETLHLKPSYGHKRLADHLDIGKAKVLRVMKLFGIKPYRRRARKPWKKGGKPQIVFPNLLLNVFPAKPNQIWVSDFTHINYQGRVLYLATIMDIFHREVAGFSVMLSHGISLIINALLMALNQRPPPEILHSDQGSEYTSKGYVDLVELFGIQISMSRVASPWENGYQESFYSQFKVDLGDPNRFESLGELIYAIYQTLHSYNRDRIHTSLKTSPFNYLNRYLSIHEVS
jgi:putative transposase